MKMDNKGKWGKMRNRKMGKKDGKRKMEKNGKTGKR